MALISCPECGKQISDKAAVCIHCGYALNEEKMKALNIKGTEVTESKAAGTSFFTKLDILESKFSHPKFITLDRSMILGIAGSFISFISLFMPFMSLGIIEISLNKTDDGIFFIVATILSLVFAFLSGLPGAITYGLATGATVLFSVLEITHLFDQPDTDNIFLKDATLRPEIGTFILILGIAVMVTGLVFKIIPLAKRSRK